MQKKFVLLLLSHGLVTNLFAGTMGTSSLNTSKKVMSLSIGPAWYKAGDTQTFLLTPDVQKTYVANQKNQTLGDAEFFYGWQKPISSLFTGQIGAAVAVTSSSLSRND